MKKVRSNARWVGLPAAQRQVPEGWLFEEGMNYEEAWRRAQAELGFQGSVSSPKRFYARRSQERLLEGLAASQEEAEAVVASPASAGLFRSAAMKLAGQLLFRQVRETPGEVKQWSALAKLMVWQEDIELRRQLKGEELALRREHLALARERFEYNAVEQALKALPQLQELAEARMDPKQREYAENRRVNAIKLRMFGKSVPEGDIKPESAEEEAAMKAGEAARREKAQAEALRRQQEQEWLAKEEEPMIEMTREELAQMARPRPESQRVEPPPQKPVAAHPVYVPPACLTDEEWAKAHEGQT